ncbi:MAG: ATP-binding protein [Eggerthellaceae bacterium]|nr:ATP-binding protein [Eggerthellaceae bacterium]
MLKRKAWNQLEDWREGKTHQALLVTGARQIGKTFLVREFARANWEHLFELNLLENSVAREAVSTAANARELFMRLTAYADVPLVPGKTLIFIDEIQEAADALTLVKFLMERGDFEYVLSGSMLGVELKSIRSAPVGFMSTVTMYPLDFEEYCWANGLAPEIVAEARRCFAEREKVDEFVHARLMELFHRYLISGGMPEPVNVFVRTDSVPETRLQQEAIVGQYRLDISKYARSRARVVRRIFDLMPEEISRQDKRFKAGSIAGDSHVDRYENDFMWLADANVSIPVYNVSEPRYPLSMSQESTKFKLFSNDVGILTYQCGMDVVRDIVNRRPDINFGAIYENAVAQELLAHGHAPFYFKNRGVGELDFVVQGPRQRVVPVEVKSGKSYKRHSALTKSLSVENWGIEQAIVLYDGNVEEDGKVLYLPVYMAMFI